ncbi:tRNA (adenosine(37)-N6)-dimethylallyltransferase MiaA [Halobacteriovorax sp. JY17]|uniref:tRNA (adenosine(37)-N6)-dimethylallyltransferase MiaA n=1 Tax=Halobacteriovorax sp. JY17 TaxID=2014617 RepID=UPI000C3FCEDF|nr:tRNA (adenosine(37)-N6)-dimethylallyltransferase MiaA [Halobacteriovorax sp. JY17]PIK16487.1 MAG: tRNA (adenosine(37)-N6)-dimethylallyltransferase MiaA [Halobacteriovorax sp. JY17]
MTTKKIIIISGPTASGKTSTSMNIYDQLIRVGLRPAIVNFDSLLFYKELSIGTAKPTQEELQNYEHHLVDIKSAKEPLNASEFLELADKTLDNLIDDGKIPIFVGGSAFYVRAFIKGMYDSTPISEELRLSIEKEYNQKGISFIREFLKENDPISFEALHENDHYRNIRAYEHFRATGSPISLEKEKAEKNNPYDFSVNRLKGFEIIHIYLDLPKDEHWSIIKDRTSKMIESGLIEEVRNLLNNGFTGKEKPLTSIGYKETIQFINGEFSTQNEYIERIAISTRQLAKSQRTFFNKVTPKDIFHPLKDKNNIVNLVISKLKVD